MGDYPESHRRLLILELVLGFGTIGAGMIACCMWVGYELSGTWGRIEHDLASQYVQIVKSQSHVPMLLIQWRLDRISVSEGLGLVGGAYVTEG